MNLNTLLPILLVEQLSNNMAHYFIFPEKDNTMYSHPTRAILNTGIDEVLTLQDEESNTDLNFYPSRILIQFKQNEINLVLLVQA